MNADAALLKAELDTDPDDNGYGWPLPALDKAAPSAERIAAEDTLCDLLAVASREVTRPRAVLKLSEMLALVRAQVLGSLMQLPVTPTFIADVNRGDRTAAGIWVTAFAAAGLLNKTEAGALLAYINPAATETVTLPLWQAIGLSQPVGRGLLRVAERS